MNVYLDKQVESVFPRNLKLYQLWLKNKDEQTYGSHKGTKM